MSSGSVFMAAGLSDLAAGAFAWASTGPAAVRAKVNATRTAWEGRHG
jgi:hypothetical protein